MKFELKALPEKFGCCFRLERREPAKFLNIEDIALHSGCRRSVYKCVSRHGSTQNECRAIVWVGSESAF
jgi:hypothetical protein